MKTASIPLGSMSPDIVTVLQNIHRYADLPTLDDNEEEQERAGASHRKETRRPDSKRHM